MKHTRPENPTLLSFLSLTTHLRTTMLPLSVHIKHQGKVHDVQLHTDQPPTVFKDAIYQVTGVPPERMKIMIKGGMLKDDHDWKKVAPKEGQTFMVIGAAGELPKPPEKPIVFLEGTLLRLACFTYEGWILNVSFEIDMDDSELAQVVRIVFFWI